MLAAASVIERLADQVPALRSVQGAAELSALMDSKAPMAAGRPFAHVVPTGMRGGQVEAIAGAFSQAIDVNFAVFLTFPSAGDPTGGRVLPELHDVVIAVIAALAGWGPSDCPGVLRLGRAGLQSFKPGAAVYVIEFAVADQLRIYP